MKHSVKSIKPDVITSTLATVGRTDRTRTTDREKQLRALYRSENALRALNILTRLENRLTAGSRFGSVRVRFGSIRFG